jgi:hypothetical protein
VVINSAGDRPSDWEIAEFAVGGQSNGGTVHQTDVSRQLVLCRSGTAAVGKRTAW